MVGTVTAPRPTRARQELEDGHAHTTITKEDIKLWRNSQYSKRWVLTGQRPLEATMTSVNMSAPQGGGGRHEGAQHVEQPGRL